MLKRKFIKRLTIIGSIIVTIFILFLFPDKNNTDINISNANSNGVIYLIIMSLVSFKTKYKKAVKTQCFYSLCFFSVN